MIAITLPCSRAAAFIGLAASLLAASAPARAAGFIDSTYYREIDQASTLGGAQQIDRVFSNAPLKRSLASDGMSGSTAVELGVLKARAQAPAWDGGSQTSNTSLASVGYRDTLTFSQAGGGWIPVTFTFALDGRVQGAAGGSAEMRMVLAGSSGSVATSMWNQTYYRDGALYTFGLSTSDYEKYFTAPACAANGSFGGDYRCYVTKDYGYGASGDKAETVTFNFQVLSGASLSVWTFFNVRATSGASQPQASDFDFSHTALLAGLQAPAGTAVASQWGGDLVSLGDGSYTYAPAAPVPEPSAAALLLAGLLWLARLRRAAA